MNQVSTCPTCGAPIYMPEIINGMPMPRALMTCDCREYKRMAQQLPPGMPAQPVPPPWFPNQPPVSA